MMCGIIALLCLVLMYQWNAWVVRYKHCNVCSLLVDDWLSCQQTPACSLDTASLACTGVSDHMHRFDKMVLGVYVCSHSYEVSLLYHYCFIPSFYMTPSFYGLI